MNHSDFILELGNGMEESQTFAKAGLGSDKSSYHTKGTTTGYQFGDSKKRSITYVEGDAYNFEFEGLASTAKDSSFLVKEEDGQKILRVGKTAVDATGETTFQLTNHSEFTLELGNGMSSDATPTSAWGDLTDGSISYLADKVLDHYDLDNKSKTISFVAGTEGTEALKLTGVASKPADVTDNKVTLKLANFEDNLTVASNTGGYEFSIAKGTYTGKTFTGTKNADVITATSTKNLTINAGNGNDSVTASGAGVTVLGGSGNDTLNGGSGAQTLSGGAGNDYLFGGAGNDSLYGAAGADTLWGGAGNDTLTGGAANDTFIYKPGEGTDHITDYATGDILQITDGTFSAAAFADNKLTLTIDGGGSVIFDNISASTQVNINNENYSIKDGTLSKN